MFMTIDPFWGKTFCFPQLRIIDPGQNFPLTLRGRTRFPSFGLFCSDYISTDPSSQQQFVLFVGGIISSGARSYYHLSSLMLLQFCHDDEHAASFGFTLPPPFCQRHMPVEKWDSWLWPPEPEQIWVNLHMTCPQIFPEGPRNSCQLQMKQTKV